MKNQLISIIVPVYNREKLVAETLESVIAQTYQNWECIIVDDGSTDNTWQVLEEFAKRDEKISIFNRDSEPKGAPTCRNIGIEKSNGDYLMFLDSDDLLLNSCLEYRIEKASFYKNYDAVIFPTGVFKNKIGDSDIVWNQLSIETEDIVRFLRQDMPWDISGPLWNMKKQIKGKWFDEQALSFQDWEMHINKLLEGINYKKIDESSAQITSYYRKQHETETISKTINEPSKVLNRAIVINKVCSKIISLYPGAYTIEIQKLLIRQCNHLKIHQLNKEAMMLWHTISGEISFFSFIFWKAYIQLKNINTFFARIVDFIALRILKRQKYLLNSSTFLNKPVE